MKPVVIDGLIAEIEKCVARHKLAPGCYARWLWMDPQGKRQLGRNEYGCADAANILYTIGAFPAEGAERAAFVENLQAMQEPETGLYREATHHTIHTTAHCMAALELFDAKPLYKATALAPCTTKEGLYQLLEQESVWGEKPWPGSHQGAGILPSLVNCDMVGLDWKNWYFDWMWQHSDPELGFVVFGEKKALNPRDYMCSGFHYLFNHEAEHRPLRYPEKIIDFCLHMMADPVKYEFIGNRVKDGQRRTCDFIDVDVVYSLNRAMRQSPHRFYEAKAALERYAESYIAMFSTIDFANDESFNDLHMLFGAVCCLAELQSALPGKLLSTKPLRLVLDRRPFI